MNLPNLIGHFCLRSMALTVISVGAFLCAEQASNAQNKSIEDLNREKAKLQSIIEQNNKLMNEYANRRNSELMQISVVDNKISKRKSLLELYDTEIKSYNDQIVNLQHTIDSLEIDIKRQKADYAEILRNIQARGTGYSQLAYILSSKSFNQSYRRFLFLKQYTEYRKEQFVKLNKSIENLNSLKAKLTDKIGTVQDLKSQVNGENAELSKELEARKQNVDKIAKSQDDLKVQIMKAQEQTKKLEEQIVKIIKEEAEKARREAEEAKKRAAEAAAAAEREKAKNAAKNKSKAPAKGTATETAAAPKSAPTAVNPAEALAEDITANKGKLPWPVRSFVVTSYYGEHDHPLVPQIKIRNNGVDMDILASREIHPVFKGKVSRIIIIPGSSASVIIRHGSVLTVYSNLQQVFVKKDQEVTVNTNLGTVFNGEGINSNILHFEIWNGDQKQDPETWLKKL